MKKVNSRITENQKAELEDLKKLPEHMIDTTDIPEVLNWSDSKRGVFFRPVKQQISMRLDADLVNWFKIHSQGREYQTDINLALREHVRRCESQKAIADQEGKD